ncbi:hypothetical protein ACJJTC_011626 [Scirpophaga incertulas]
MRQTSRDCEERALTQRRGNCNGGGLFKKTDACACGANDSGGVANECARVYTAVAGLAGDEAAGTVPSMQGNLDLNYYHIEFTTLKGCTKNSLNFITHANLDLMNHKNTFKFYVCSDIY